MAELNSRPVNIYGESIDPTVFRKISQINRKDRVTILIVEHKVRQVLDICHRVYSVKLGKVAFACEPAKFKEDKEKLKLLFL